MDHLRFANQGLEGELARLAAAAVGGNAAAGKGGGGVELELLRHELEDLRHDNQEMENGFHEAAAQVCACTPAVWLLLDIPWSNSQTVFAAPQHGNPETETASRGRRAENAPCFSCKVTQHCTELPSCQ